MSEPKQITLSVRIGTVAGNFDSSLGLLVLFGLLRGHKFRNLLARFMSEDLVCIIIYSNRPEIIERFNQSDFYPFLSTQPWFYDQIVACNNLDFKLIWNFSCSSIIVRTIRETLITISKLLQKWISSDS